ncbi:cation:proton antiporter [Novilysobacter erysipheiresistens]|uniref:Cation:proton antiporter n=1 Tax=Novilysobacter erysipheiresistens TaxID=1749332 RepID=A0ABU7YW68_9GAMM
MDPYKLLLAVTGLALIGATWLPHLLKRHPVTFPMIYVTLGIVLYALPLQLPDPDPFEYRLATERLTELVVLVALVGAGLRLDTPFGWRRWSVTWRLLAITMPLCILAAAWLGQLLLGLSLASALLLGAVLAPTDPVLASDVQVGGPDEGREDAVRFGLTSEAGLNDGLAFPFVWLAIAVAALTSGTAEPHWFAAWLWRDVAWRVVGGVLVGWLVGYGLMWLIFRTRSQHSLSRTSDGLAALAITLFVYGVAELCHVYGFLAVFVAAVVIRQHERSHRYHGTLNLFAEQCERLLTALLLILLGGTVAIGVLGPLQLVDIAFSLAFVLLVRPLAGALALVRSPLAGRERWMVSLFGIRGMGSFYYLAFALNHGQFDQHPRLWAIVTLVVLLSIALHGMFATGAMARLDLWRARRGRRRHKVRAY